MNKLIDAVLDGDPGMVYLANGKPYGKPHGAGFVYNAKGRIVGEYALHAHAKVLSHTGEVATVLPGMQTVTECNTCYGTGDSRIYHPESEFDEAGDETIQVKCASCSGTGREKIPLSEFHGA